MKDSAFLIANAPEDKEYLKDIIESILEVRVKEMKFLSVLKTTALVILEDEKSLKDITTLIQEELRNGDYGFDKDITLAVVVTNLDEEVLSPELLTLFIESTYSDGYATVSSCQRIPDCDRTALLTMEDTDVMMRVLQMGDHTPMPSLSDYHIHFKIFDSKLCPKTVSDSALKTNKKLSNSHAGSFHADSVDSSTTDFTDNKAWQSFDSEVYTSSVFDPCEFGTFSSAHSAAEQNEEEVKENISMNANDKPWQSFGGEMNTSYIFDPQEYGPPTDSEETGPVSLEEEKPKKESISVTKSKWDLIKDKVKSIACQADHDEGEEKLHIGGKDVLKSKDAIIDILRNIKTASLSLTKDQRNVLASNNMKEILQSLCDEYTFDVMEQELKIYSHQNVDSHLESFKELYLYSKSIQIPETFPSGELEELKDKMPSYFVVVMSWDKETCTLTGQKEDVMQAFKDVDEKFDDYRWIDRKFTITGNQAEYVKKIALEDLKKLLRETIISRDVVDDREICFEYKCKKNQKSRIANSLKLFKQEIKEHKIDLTVFQGENLALVGKNLEGDVHILRDFESTYGCCIMVEGIGRSGEFFQFAPKSKAKPKPNVPKLKKTIPARGSNRNKNMKCYDFGTSCNLQVSSGGNIEKENSELLVCGIDKSLNLDKTFVSKAFLKADPSLQTDVTSFQFSGNGVAFSSRSLRGSSCKAIAFIRLKMWQQGSSDSGLTAAITEVLDYANNNGLKSISFPPLGIGRRFNFPADETSQAFMTALETFEQANSSHLVTYINIIAADRKFFPLLCKKADDSSSCTEQTGASSDSDQEASDEEDDDGNEDEEEDSGGAQAEGSEVELEMLAIGEDKVPSVVIVSTRDDIMLKFLKTITKEWLYEDQFKPVDFCWPPQFINEFTQEAKVCGVWLCKLQDAATKQHFCQLKGKIEEVRQLKDKMVTKYLELNKTQPRKNLFGQGAPSRGSIDFIKHASSCDDQLPAYWNLKTQDLQNMTRTVQGSFTLHDLDDKTKTAITNVINQTWDVTSAGRGHDASGIPLNSSVKVLNVQRVENAHLFLKYSSLRKSILRDMSSRKRLCEDAGKLPGSKGEILTMTHLKKKSMKQELLYEVNELYLLHGTKDHIVESICQQGMDTRLSSDMAMFGRGVYMGESSTKADQYSDERDNRLPNGSNLYMFLTRTTLGDIFLCDSNHKSVQQRDSKKLCRPPCRTCGEDVCRCHPAVQNHSVMGDGKWIFREFVVYHNDQCYPEYLITYQRQ